MQLVIVNYVFICIFLPAASLTNISVHYKKVSSGRVVYFTSFSKKPSLSTNLGKKSQIIKLQNSINIYFLKALNQLHYPILSLADSSTAPAVQYTELLEVQIFSLPLIGTRNPTPPRPRWAGINGPI